MGCIAHRLSALADGRVVCSNVVSMSSQSKSILQQIKQGCHFPLSMAEIQHAQQSMTRADMPLCTDRNRVRLINVPLVLELLFYNGVHLLIPAKTLCSSLTLCQLTAHTLWRT